ncbi:putative bifunctional diguanylate cyclase/phosphodiesterase [Erythrobacter sp. R86502]|uniref:putative bifunctional diguanylate cyclase/phosphodiesterase n=1 Tax=Erythrobacter sp. R86502 TaxID=3093846 RepID=UPI0036D33D0A
MGWTAWRLRRDLAQQVAAAEAEIGIATHGPLSTRAANTISALVARTANEDSRDLRIHSITGLPTREILFEKMAADTTGTLIVLTCRDYDRLCTFDPALGERVLLLIVARLRAMLAASRMIAQIDRAHFAVWLGPEASEASAEAEARAMLYALSNRLVEENCEILPGIALRSTRFEAGQRTPQAAVSAALSAFAVATEGHHENVLVDATLAAHTKEQFDLEQDLRQAIVRGELHMAFQPLFDAEIGRVCGAEALIRWTHPVHGNIPPSRFIPVIEAAGITQEFSLWALNYALREAREWRASGCMDMRVAVNLSGKDLEVEALPSMIERTLVRHGLAPDALEIELTESVALADGDRAARFCRALRSMGVAVAIDDFGTGYSSLSALRALRFAKLKIDRSFVTAVDQRRDSQAICNALLALGRGLGINILAEGVETAAEYAWLRARGCRYYQGYHFSRPLSSADFVAFVRDSGRGHDLAHPVAPMPLERLSL